MRSVTLKTILSFMLFLLLLTTAWRLNHSLDRQKQDYRIKSHQDDIDIVELVEHEIEPFGSREYIRIRTE